MSKAQEFREYAAECLRLAKMHPDERDDWVKLAARWAALAVKADKEDDPPETQA